MQWGFGTYKHKRHCVYFSLCSVSFFSLNLWTGNLFFPRSADDRLKEHRDAYAVVSSDGNVLWIPQAIFKSSCVIDITHFPFDEQTCFLKFGSWTYDGFKLDISFFDDLDEVDLNDYIESNEWKILDNPAKKNVKYYPCCQEPYPDLTFTVKLRRKVAFYNYILILPCVLLSSLTLVLFWLPPESPAKMVLGEYPLSFVSVCVAVLALDWASCCVDSLHNPKFQLTFGKVTACDPSNLLKRALQVAVRCRATPVWSDWSKEILGAKPQNVWIRHGNC